MLSDKEAREYIADPKSFNKSMFIEAGAGAGKSTVIVERIVGLLRLNKDPSRIVAITFTNKAAEELRGRIINALFDNVQKEQDINIKNNLSYALNNINNMNISTIHSFCKTLLTQKCIEANLPYNFKLIEDDDVTRREDICFRDWSNSNLTDQDHYLLSSFGDTVKSYMDSIKEIYKILVNQIEPISKDKIYREPIDESIVAKYRNFIDDVYKNIVDNVSSEKDLLNAGTIFKESYEKLVNKNNLKTPKVVDLYKLFTIISSGKVFSSKSDKSEYNELISTELSKLSKEECKVVSNNEKYLNYFDFACKAYQYYLIEISKHRNELSNNQLIYEAYILLKDKKIRNYFSSKYPIIFIDEYQDTDHYQWEIARRLTMDDNGNFLSGSTLFLVGDPKQSIYRFRGAEPTVYFETKEIFSNIEKAGGNAICLFLEKNFRSHKDVISWVNDKYSSQENEIRLTNETYVSMINDEANELDDEDPNKLHGVYYYDDNSASGLARLINSLVDRNSDYKASTKIKDDNKKHHYKWDDILYKDILVITPKAEGVDSYLQVLAENDIPYSVDGIIYLFNDKAIRIFINLLSSLLDINNSKSLLGSIEALRATSFDYSSNYNEETTYLASIVDKVREDIKNLSSYGKVEYLINHPEYYLDKDYTYKAFEINHIKAKLYSLMETCFAEGNKNDLDIVEFFSKKLEKTIERELSLEDDPNAVRVMNMHKSKGLQGKIVIYAKRDMKATFSYETVYKDGYLYLGMTDAFSHLNWCSYFFNEKIYNSIQNDHNLEVARLEYVVSTRAEQVLIFTPPIKEEVHFNRSNVNYQLENLHKLEILQNNEDLHEKVRKNDTILEKYEINSLSKFDSKLSDKIYDVSTPSGTENEKSLLREKYLEEAKNRNESLVNLDRPGNNILGSCLHRAFELFHNNLKIKESSNIVDFCVKQSLYENEISDSLYENYYEFISSCLNASFDWMRNIIKTNNSEAENKFYYFDKDNNTWWNGSIDLCVRNGDSIDIYDYKSDEAIYIHDDSEFEKTLLEKYASQLEAYKKAMSVIYPEIKNVSLTIVYFRNYRKDSKKVDAKLLLVSK